MSKQFRKAVDKMLNKKQDEDRVIFSAIVNALNCIADQDKSSQQFFMLVLESLSDEALDRLDGLVHAERSERNLEGLFDGES